jgi:hypothetical protein
MGDFLFLPRAADHPCQRLPPLWLHARENDYMLALSKLGLQVFNLDLGLLAGRVAVDAER